MKIIGVSEGVLKYIRVNIITQDLQPGQKLNEIELSEKMGVSRSPLREAFRVLEGEGLVETIIRKGSYVTKMSRKNCEDIYEAREMMECFAVDILKKKRARKIPLIKSALKKSITSSLDDSSDPYDRYEYIESIGAFHFKLIEQSGNSRIFRFYKALFPCLARYQAIYTYPEVMGSSHKEHSKIVELIENGKYGEAKNELKLHIEKFVKMIFEQNKF